MVIMTVIMIGLSLLARMLAPKPKSGFMRDSKPTALAERGSFIPLVLGRRRVGPIFCWAGGRRVVTEGGGGGGSGIFGGGGGDPEIQIYYETGFHAICVGPASKLFKIYQEGKNILKVNRQEIVLDRVNYPSGSYITLDGRKGNFYIYWGDFDQPVNTRAGAASRMGVSSRWPLVCYLYWDQKRLGQQAVWPMLDYEIECQGGTSPLEDSSQWLNNNTTTGVNPAHAICQLMTAAYPHGAGLSPDFIDKTTLEHLGDICESEHLPFNMVAGDGVEANKKLAEMIQDLGLLMPIRNGRISFYPIREPEFAEFIPTVSDDFFLPDRVQTSIALSPRRSTRLMFLYIDRTENHRQADIIIDDDKVNECGVNAPKIKEVDIPSVTDRDAASKIVERRSREELSPLQAFTIKATRGAREFYPGMRFTSSVYGSLRVLTVKLDSMSSVVELECLKDYYGVSSTGWVPVTLPPLSLPPALANDIAVEWVEVTEPSDPSPVIIVARLRANQCVVGAQVQAQVGGGVLQILGTQDAYSYGGAISVAMTKGEFTVVSVDASQREVTIVGNVGSGVLSVGDEMRLNSGVYVNVFTTIQTIAGGSPNSVVTVTQSLSLGDTVGGTFNQEMMETGPSFTFANDDVEVANQQGDPGAWRAGTWVALIEQELFYIRNVELIAGYAYYLKGLIRAQQGTIRAAHSSSKKVYIFPSELARPLTGLQLVPGATVLIKAVPYTADDVVDPNTVSGVTHTLKP